MAEHIIGRHAAHEDDVDETQAPHPSAAIVDYWFHEVFPGTCVARDTVVYSFVHDAVQDLKKRLSGAPRKI